MVIILAVLIIITVIILYFVKSRAGITGWVKDTDLDGKGRNYYVNKKLNIGCKPDVLEGGRVIEYKSASFFGNKPFSSHLVQLVAEMIATGASHGVLRYGNGREFVYKKNSPEIISAGKVMHANIVRMREHLISGTIPSGRPSQKKCTKCGYKKHCHVLHG